LSKWNYLLIFSFFLLLFVVELASAELPLYLKPLQNGSLQPNTNFSYVFNFTTESDCSGVILSNSSQITTGEDGVGFIAINIENISAVPYYLCEYRNGELRKTHVFADEIFRDISARTINVTGNITALGVICDSTGCITVDTDTDTNESSRFNNLTTTNCTGTNKMVGVNESGGVICGADVDTTDPGIWTNASGIATFDGGLNVSNETYLGNSEIDTYLFFYEGGNPKGEFIVWRHSSDDFLISDALAVTNQIFSAGDIYTTGAGDDLWLGTNTQENANFRAYADGGMSAINTSSANITATEGFYLNQNLSITENSTTIIFDGGGKDICFGNC